MISLSSSSLSLSLTCSSSSSSRSSPVLACFLCTFSWVSCLCSCSHIRNISTCGFLTKPARNTSSNSSINTSRLTPRISTYSYTWASRKAISLFRSVSLLEWRRKALRTTYRTLWWDVMRTWHSRDSFTLLLFRSLCFGVLGKQWRIQWFQGLAFGAEEPLSSLLQGPEHRHIQPLTAGYQLPEHRRPFDSVTRPQLDFCTVPF